MDGSLLLPVELERWLAYEEDYGVRRNIGKNQTELMMIKGW
jgi:hypothetical protein